MSSNNNFNMDSIFNDASISSEMSQDEIDLISKLSDDIPAETGEGEGKEDPLKPEGKEKKEPTIAPPSFVKKVHESEEDFVKEFGATDDDGSNNNPNDGDGSHDGGKKPDVLPGVNDNKGGEEDLSENFKVVAEGLFKLGKFGDDVKLPEKLDEASFIKFYDEYTENKIQAGIEDKISDRWGEEGIKIFEDVFVKGVDPRQYFEIYNENLDYNELDMTKDHNQKLIVSRYLEEMGQDNDEIAEQIDMLIEKGKLAERSEKYKEKLVEDNSRRLETMAADKEAKIKEMQRAHLERVNAIKEVAKEAISKKEIKGIPLSINDSKDLVSYATDLNWKLPNGSQITDADKAILEIKRDPTKWLALCKLLKEDLNIGPIKTKAVEEKAEEVFNFRKTKKTNTDAGNSSDALDLFLKRKF